MSCPYASKKAEEPAPSEGKCPYMAKKEEEQKQQEAASSSEGKCPYMAKKEEEQKAAAASSASDGKCPYLAKQRGESTEDGVTQSGPEYLPQRDWSKATPDQFKEHFQSAYNELGANVSSKVPHDEIANILMGKLGYTQEEIDIIGKDNVWQMQGTGNPHIHADLKPGQVVADLGSGLGLDCLLASAKVGPTGRVVGLDLSINEIAHAIQRISARKLRNIDFRLGDIEDPPFEDASIDRFISNGGFCLVPQKDKSFRELFRCLKPGGKISISCTARLQPLDESKQWPSCFMVFIDSAKIDAMLTEIGFTDVGVDMTNSEMDVWDKIKTKEVEKRDVTIHRGDPKYGFIKEYDMNKMFARVTIYATKPTA